MSALTQSNIITGLKNLGLQAGDRVLVHSSLAALGEVEGGADSVIEALLETVGPDGLVVVPTFACRAPFDRRTSATPLGIIADRFWRRPGAVRSLHPTHSVAAIGKGAEELIRDHEKAPTAYAEGTPYHKLATNGGKILLLGVDQDRNTTLHTAEALAGAVYLTDIHAAYIDDNGSEVTIPIAAMAGPHRNFIGMDRLFRERGIMKIAKIGSAICRLIDAGPMLESAVNALHRDPAAVLCDNPECQDCISQRAKIKAARLSEEDFTFAAVASDISDDFSEIIKAIKAEGISALELTPDNYERYGSRLKDAEITITAIRGCAQDPRAPKIAADLGVPYIMPLSARKDFGIAAQIGNSCAVIIENAGLSSSSYSEFLSSNGQTIRFAFSPAAFAGVGEKPFLQVFYKGTLRKHTAHFYISDATVEGKPALPGQGNGEVKEIISALRCRSYNGVMTLRSAAKGAAAFRESAAAFWRLMDEM